MGQAGSVNNGVQGRLFIGDLPVPGFVHVTERPGILEGCSAASLPTGAL